MARRVAVALLAAVAVACGEPAPDVDVPPREPGQSLLDHASVLADAGIEDRLAGMPADVVALAYESPAATRGDADRAGRLLLDAWDADVAVVAVAMPGDFASADEASRQRFFGVVAADVRLVSRGARERIVDEVVPPLAARNDWAGAFQAALDELEADLRLTWTSWRLCAGRRPANAPCYGFVAEGVTEGGDGEPADVVVVAYGARRHHPRITAAHLEPDGTVGRFAEAEPLAPGAMPFLAPLQQAAEAAEVPPIT
jgi:hypothetical protein